MRALAVIAEAEVGVNLQQALVDEEAARERTREGSAEESCGDNAQGGVGGRGGQVVPSGVEAAGGGERQGDIGVDLADAVGAEQGDGRLAARAGPSGVKRPERMLK